jgi:uncharacterized membrane protein
VGLALALLVVAKVFLADLQGMAAIYRVIAFVVLGAILLLGSYAYIQSGRKFTRKTGDSATNPPA